MLLLSCAFLPSSSGHTFFSEETPTPRSRWNQSAFLSFRSLVGKSLCEDKRARGGRETVEIGSWGRWLSAFLHGCFSFVLLFTLPSSLPSLSNILCPPPPLSTSKLSEKKPPPSFGSYNSHLLTSNKKKKNPERKLKWTLTVNLIQTF